MSTQLDHRAEDVAQFFYDLTPQERRDRFGLPGGSTIDWLLERIARDANRAAFAARFGGRVVGVLDFVYEERDIEFGILVGSEFRRRGIGSALVRLLLEATCGSGMSLVASCEHTNAPALRMLAKFGFRRRAQGRGTLWLGRPAEV